MKLVEKKNTPIALLSGFTLMEIIVGLIIISIVFGGLIATFVGVKRYVARATRRVVSTNLDRQVLNSLYRDVRANDWDTGPLKLGDHDSTEAGLDTAVTIDNFNYGDGATPNTYTVQNVTVGGNITDYRQVTVNVTYPTN